MVSRLFTAEVFRHEKVTGPRVLPTTTRLTAIRHFQRDSQVQNLLRSGIQEVLRLQPGHVYKFATCQGRSRRVEWQITLVIVSGNTRGNYLHGRTSLPWEGPVPFAARLCFERGTQAQSVFPIVRAVLNIIMELAVDFPYRVTLDEIAQLNQDTSIALTTIREWMNSFAPINRLPLDVLSLIPTHLHSQKDHFGATFVCRHWRRTFLQNATLWSHLCLSKGEVYIKTLLKRARGSPLTILANRTDPVGTVMLLPPYTKQIRNLGFKKNSWLDIQRFSETNSGALPLLHTLNINAVAGTAPGGPLFRGAVGLKEFQLRSEGLPFLNRFIFPNLTSFELSMYSVERFRGSQLLDFLEALPMLRAVRMKIYSAISLKGIPPDKVLVLHNVESLSLAAKDGGYELATHMSCPSTKYTSLTHMHKEEPDYFTALKAFPSPVSWNTIIRQYTTSPIEEVTFEIKSTSVYFIACFIAFRSADTAVIKLGFEIPMDKNSSKMPFEPTYCHIFTEASRTIQDLTSVKRLHMIGHPELDHASEQTTCIRNDLRRLLQSLGPLEELTLHRCNVQPYLLSFLSPYPESSVPYPPTKVLTISRPIYTTRIERFVDSLVAIAKVQHGLGEPFERVTIRMFGPPARIKEKVRPWVGAVDCFEVPYSP